MNIEKLVEYQKKDFEIVKLERELENGENRQVITQMVSLIKDSQNKSLQLEKKANELNLEYQNLLKSISHNKNSLESLTKKDLSKLSSQELTAIENVVNTINTNLNVLEKKLINLAEAINLVLTQFDKAKKVYNEAKDKYNYHKEQYTKQQEVIQPKIDQIKKELAVIEKDIDPELLAKYKQKRQDKNFPIFVALKDRSCGGCQMEISYASTNRLKEKGFIECENCRRIIYQS